MRSILGMSFGSMMLSSGISVIFHFRFLLCLMMSVFCVFIVCSFYFGFLNSIVPSGVVS